MCVEQACLQHIPHASRREGGPAEIQTRATCLKSERAIHSATPHLTIIFSACRYLLILDHLKIRPSQFWNCGIWVSTGMILNMCSTLLILNMTFERFYSIVRPHKAASFNTVKRAKITIVCIVVFSISYNIPHLFVTRQIGKRCIPYGNRAHGWGQVYYWLSLTIRFFLPFSLLLIMNSFIIQTLRVRSNFIITKSEGQGQTQGQGDPKIPKMKNAERQIFVTLLLVTFAFLILTTPAYLFYFYGMFVNFTKSAQSFAEYYLFNNAARQAYITNYGINFYLYVLSGKKFRSDLINLFKCSKETLTTSNSNSEIVTQTSAV